MIKEKSLFKGQRAEQSFEDIYAFDLFGQNSLWMYDETGRFREGEYRLPDGSIIELKGDWRCYSLKNPTGNLPIESYHSGHARGYGWLQHCAENGVDYIVFACFRAENKPLPYCVICIPFQNLVRLIKEYASRYPYRKIHDGSNTVGFYCVPINEIRDKCGAKVIKTRNPKPIAKFIDEWTEEAEYALWAMGIDGKLGEVTVTECTDDGLQDAAKDHVQ